MKRNIWIRNLVATVLIVVLTSVGAFARDWWESPATVYIKSAPRVVAVGDVHGGFPQMADALEAAKVVRRDSADPFRLYWCGGDTVLVFIGDLIDRGLFATEVMDSVMELQKQAPLTGGRVVVLIGNHEVMLLNGTVEARSKDPSHKEQVGAQMTVDSIQNAGMDYRHSISPVGKYGRWVRNLPLYAIINGYLFIHAGYPKEKGTVKEILRQFRAGIEADTWADGIFVEKIGPLWNRGWWNKPELVQHWEKEFQVSGIVFGHTIGALGKLGFIDHIGTNIVSIDIGMTPMYGNSNGGALLINTRSDGRMYFRAKYPDRPEQILFSVPAPATSRPFQATRRLAGREGKAMAVAD